MVAKKSKKTTKKVTKKPGSKNTIKFLKEVNNIFKNYDMYQENFNDIEYCMNVWIKNGLSYQDREILLDRVDFNISYRLEREEYNSDLENVLWLSLFAHLRYFIIENIEKEKISEEDFKNFMLV